MTYALRFGQLQGGGTLAIVFRQMFGLVRLPMASVCLVKIL